MAQKILIVDDDASITGLLKRRLEDYGYECEECWDPIAAQQRLESERFDLVLLDYSMPSMKGDEFCMTLREQEKFKNLPIIMITAFTNKGTDFFIEIGATDVMFKPVDEEELDSKIKKHLKIQ